MSSLIARKRLITPSSTSLSVNAVDLQTRHPKRAAREVVVFLVRMRCVVRGDGVDAAVC